MNKTKSTLLTIISLMMVLPLFSQKKSSTGVKFETGTFSQALAKAKNNKKGPNLVFVDCYTEWCGPCKMVAEKVFPLPHVGEFFNSQFINFKIDMEKGEGPELGKKYSIAAYPTFLILDGDGNEINRIVGAGGAEQFLERVRKAMNPANSPDSIKMRYLKYGMTDDLVNYLEQLKSTYRNNELSSFLTENFQKINVHDRYGAKVWPIISYLVKERMDMNILKLIIEDRTYASFAGMQEQVDRAAVQALKQITSFYLSDKLARFKTPQEAESLISNLPLLSSNDVTIPYFVNSVKYYKSGEFEKIGEMLNVGQLNFMSQNDRQECERLLLNIKGLPQEIKDRYRQDQINYYQRVLEQLKK